jgi:hypothetical protein
VLQPRDPAALAQFATDVSTPGSPLYRHYLAPGQFSSVFGPTDASIAAVETALRAEGLNPGTISEDHLSIPVTATTEQLATAFSIGFLSYQLPGGRVAYANTAAPLLPGSVVGLVQGVIGLDDLELAQPADLTPSPKPSATASTPQVVTGGPQPCSAAVDAAPDWYAYTADQLASAYQFSSLYGAHDFGSGVTVALYELAPNLTSDISGYQTCYGTSASVSYVEVDGGSTTTYGGTEEATLDIEDVIGLAPEANIIVYQGPNGSGTGPYDTYQAIVDADTAQVISTSWLLCEPLETSTEETAENTLFEEAAGQGQSIFAATGDTGSEGCERNDDSTALAVGDPASQPYVTGVGGTTLSVLGPPPTETVWNETANSAGAAGGGVSADWTMPSYQSGAPSSLHVINANSSGTPCAAATGKYCREVPDVSADADPYTSYLIYYNYPDGDSGHNGWQGIGGTSAAAPLWAALMALIDADSTCSGKPIGFANPVLYAAAATTSYSSAFHDITSGNNDYGDQHGGLYPAGTAYDMASGLGTPNVGALAGLLCGVLSPSPPTNVIATSPASGDATVSWTAPASGVAEEVTGYTVTTYNDQGAAVGTPQSVSGESTSTTTVTSLTNGTPWYFSVASVNRAGDSTAVESNSVTPLSGTAPGAALTAASALQYLLPNSNGTTWQVMDESNLAFTITPGSSENVLLSANSDLWTFDAGYNQDIGIQVTPGAGSPVLAAWKESGGFAGTYSPNAAFVETVYPMSAGTTYTVQVVYRPGRLEDQHPRHRGDHRRRGGADRIGLLADPADRGRAPGRVPERGEHLPVHAGEQQREHLVGDGRHPPGHDGLRAEQCGVGGGERQRGSLDGQRRVQPGPGDLRERERGDPGAPGLEGVGRIRGDVLTQRGVRADGVRDDLGEHLCLLAGVEDQHPRLGGDHLCRGWADRERLLADPADRVRAAGQQCSESVGQRGQHGAVHARQQRREHLDGHRRDHPGDTQHRDREWWRGGDGAGQRQR